jgi:hypothetical protein
MGIDIKESIRIAKIFKEKKARGENLNKGEEVILTLASEYAKIHAQDFKISNELCVDIISVHKERIGQSKESSIPVDTMEMNMLLDGLLERLYIS